jgi:hypothetical protein
MKFRLKKFTILLSLGRKRVPDLEQLEKDIREAMDVAYRADRKIDTHEDICALRYSGIQSAMTDLKAEIGKQGNRMWIAAGAVIMACLSVILFLVGKIH